MRIFGDPTIEKITKFLDYSAQRQQVINSNLANLETPGYRAKELTFGDVFRSELSAQAPMRTSDPRHAGARPVLLRQPVVEEAQTGSMGHDGNNVDLDKELTKLAENVLKFSLAVQALQNKLQMIEYSIKEGRA